MTTTESIIAASENAPRIGLPLLREVPPAILKRRPKPGKWSAHERACHLAAVHPLMVGRLDLMLSERLPEIKPYLPHLDDDPDALLKVDLNEALDRFAREREDLIRRLRSLSESDWARTAAHGSTPIIRYSLC